jgi:hypothetical protein
MTDKKTYKTAEALRTALSDRLKIEAKKQDIELQRLTRQVAYDRLLARIFSERNAPFLLKGGYAMQLRVSNARGTKDVDLALRNAKLLSSNSQEQNEAIFEYLRKTAAKDLGDFFSFTISPPVMDLEAAPYGGARFRVEAVVDGRTFEKFLLDIGVGDVWIEPASQLECGPWLEFAGIPTVKYPSISPEQQFAEKVHAYTLPRGEGVTNSRVKDLVDMVLLISGNTLDAKRIRTAIEATYERRGTHPFNKKLLPPPASWSGPYGKLAEECELPREVDIGFSQVETFLNSCFG